MGYNPNVHIVHIFAVLMYTCAPVLLGLAVLDHLPRLVTHTLRPATLLVRGRGGVRGTLSATPSPRTRALALTPTLRPSILPERVSSPSVCRTYLV